MELNTLKYNKGVAGLTLLLSLVTFLFVIGFIVMIFSLMGASLKDADIISASESYTTAIASQDMNTSLTLATCDSATEGVLTAINSARNVTGQGLIPATNYTFSGCEVSVVGELYNNTAWNISYTFTQAGTGYTVINDTVAGIGTTTDWFDIFIVIGAMVVLILLTVIIIVSIRGSGMMGESNNSANRNFGSA